MSISDLIVVMKDGVLQQIGKPQDVYDMPANLFVAKFLGTPAINVFEGEVKNSRLYIGGEDVLSVTGAPDGEVWVGIRPEGFSLDEGGAFKAKLERVEVMGRDTSVVSTHEGCVTGSIRSIIPSEERPDGSEKTVSFSLKPFKTHLFSKDTEERIPFSY